MYRFILPLLLICAPVTHSKTLDYYATRHADHQLKVERVQRIHFHKHQQRQHRIRHVIRKAYLRSVTALHRRRYFNYRK